MNNYRNKYEYWCQDPYFDHKTQEELLSIASDDEEIQDRFYCDLEFGTGGLRGVIGAGTNRMNIYTVRKATQGLANFIQRKDGAQKGVAIAFDSRRFSQEFALEAALCLSANGIRTYLFDELRPTPELSFAVRKLGCIAGIVITASHNPPEYNGYKVYWEDGAQITFPMDEAIISEVKKVTEYQMVMTMEKEKAIEKKLLTIIGKEIDDAYMEELKKLVLHPDLVREMGKAIKIVYTPIHGTGNIPVRRILKEIGFEKVYVVDAQELPDENFSTVSYPNPEDPCVFELALELAKEVDADIILATDPDADRLGVYAKDRISGEYQAFTGNMSGILICEYLLSQKKKMGLLTPRSAIIKTIVTTNMADVVADYYGVSTIETLTGFKYIGEQIKIFEQNNSYEYEFGFEESYGCLVGTHSRDKDAVAAVMALCEAAAYYKNEGLTLWDQMLNIYEKYGYYVEGLETKTFRGAEGSKKIATLMEQLRIQPPKKIGKYKVIGMRDYQSSKKTTAAGTEGINLPKSNVLYFELNDDAWFCVRPSGTEPKIKYYFGIKGSGFEDAHREIQQLKETVWKLCE